MLETQSAAEAGLTKDRIASLTDGMFMFALTLVIYDIKLPEIAPALVQAQLLGSLVAMWPKYVSTFVSFVIMGVFWVAHHNQFHYIRRADRNLLWINILFVFMVAFMPMSTQMLAHYGRTQVGVALYGVNLILTGAVLYLQWWYATHRRRLVDATLDARLIAMTRDRMRLGMGVYALAIAASFVSVPVAVALFLLVPIAYIVPGKLDRLIMQVDPAAGLPGSPPPA